MFCKYFIIILNILLKFKVNGLLCNQILLNEKRAELPMGFKNNARLGINISLCILMQYPYRQYCLYCQAISDNCVDMQYPCRQ